MNQSAKRLTVPIWIIGLACCLALNASVPLLPGKEKVDLLVDGGVVVTLDGTRRVFENGAVAVRGERILAVGASSEIADRYQGERIIDAKGKLVLPGLINTHNHAPMTLLRGIADDLALMDWLQKFIFPAEAKNVSREFVDWGTALACIEMIQSGTTTYADMYYFEDQVAEVTVRAGMRGVLGETVLQFPAPDNKTPGEALAYTEKYIRRWKGNPLITPAVAPHAPYTNSAESLKACKALADRYGVPLTIHVSETQDEVIQMREKYGLTSTQWLDSLGVLGPNVFFNHGVWLTEEDLAIVRKRGVGVTHNPESNMKLASGTAPVVRMLALGIPVGLGTDGAASNNNEDMFEAMDFAAKLHKLVTMNPSALPAAAVVEMATLGGARAMGMEKEIGSLEAGKRADLILIETDSAHGQPLYNVYSHLVYSLKGADVATSIINGKVVMLNRKVLTLDENSVKNKAREFRKSILSSLKR
jgi:5-methylthioadenosine/S-adenosylhomocysteine deaminase